MRPKSSLIRDFSLKISTSYKHLIMKILINRLQPGRRPGRRPGLRLKMRLCRLKLGSRNNLYTKPEKINITPARNKDGIVIRCITQYRRSCKISINGRSPVLNLLAIINFTFEFTFKTTLNSILPLDFNFQLTINRPPILLRNSSLLSIYYFSSSIFPPNSILRSDCFAISAGNLIWWLISQLVAPKNVAKFSLREKVSQRKR